MGARSINSVTKNHIPISADPLPDASAVCFEFAPAPMATVDGASQVVRYVNAAFRRLLKKNADRLVGKDLFDLLPGRDECALLVERVYRSGNPESHTVRQASGMSGALWSYMMWPLLPDGGHGGIVIQIVEDAPAHTLALEMNEALILGSVHQHELTEAAVNVNAELEDLVVERTAELTKTNQQLEAFAYSIAHDLRAPLRAMQGFSEMLVEEAEATLSKTARSHAVRINKAAQFMDGMLCDLLAFSRVSQSAFELSRINLAMVVEAVLLHLQSDIRDSGAQVAAGGPWPDVLAHEPTLFQVVLNLTSNALKFSIPGVPARVRLWAEDRAEFIRVRVEDNGVGIAPDYRTEIFRLFTRLNGERYPGTGIGLAIVQKGVERMGGQLGMESNPGRGSEFWFELRKA